ncbi:CHAPERONE-LIKE PROTEIN [Drosera capensis]
MSVSGVAGCPSGYCLGFRGWSSGSLGGQGARLMSIRVPTWSQNQQQLRGSCLIRGLKQFNPRHGIRISCAAGASYGDAFNDSAAVFPRLNVGDPYKRLGISREASEQEIYAAINFLIQRYGGHEPSKKAIESAYDKIIRQKLNERRRPKLNIHKKVRDMMQNKYVKMVLERFRSPSSKFIVLTAAAFIVLGVLTVRCPTYDGPTFQVGVSLFATMYFIHSRLKSKAQADWGVHSVLARRYLSHGIRDSANTKRSKGL